MARLTDFHRQHGARHINGILSLLIKEYYPGLVTIDGVRKPPMK
jgi:hypothetical protein